ncbi:MAG: SGNH/GDSL hydrolase family protein [Acetobacteraceae bacterium]|nr:SGNH/GDSL hydrolase family protein [Acetobacteraceae bacterium]
MSLINEATLGLGSVPSVLAGPSSPSASYGALYAFGDSLSDAGNIYTATFHLLPSVPYSHGHFSNGPTWAEDLAGALGLPTLKPSLQGGTDFAYGDAESGSDPLHSASPLDLPSQLAQFRGADPHPAANALYTISIGNNDVLDAISAAASNPAAATADVGQAVVNETAFLGALAQGGARNMLVLNVPDLGKTPAETSHGAAVAQTATQLSALYDSELSASLTALAAQDGLNIHVVDAFSLIDQAVANPSAFGLTNVTQPVWTGSYDNPFSGHLNATGAAQNGYLFFDSLHPTETGHLAVASAALQSLSGPGLA